jgi:6-pyruvoyltetrahydropterin/6-carboxytetrahydropterin synthase
MRAEVSKKIGFDAAHWLPGYDGPCSRVHGHHWTVEVTVSGEINDSTGMVIDFKKLKGYLSFIEEIFDHHQINDTIQNPTAENIAQFIYTAIANGLDCSLQLDSVTVWETEDSKATVRG